MISIFGEWGYGTHKGWNRSFDSQAFVTKNWAKMIPYGFNVNKGEKKIT